jgi:hypothetical protein
MVPGGPGQAGSLLLYWRMVTDVSLNWSSCRKTKQRRSIIADDARAFSPPGCAWRGCSGKETTADWKDLKLKKYTSVTEGPLRFYEMLMQLRLFAECILLLCVFTHRSRPQQAARVQGVSG